MLQQNTGLWHLLYSRLFIISKFDLIVFKMWLMYWKSATLFTLSLNFHLCKFWFTIALLIDDVFLSPTLVYVRIVNCHFVCPQLLLLLLVLSLSCCWLTKHRFASREAAQVVKELDNILAFNNSLISLSKHHEASRFALGVGPVSLIGRDASRIFFFFFN